VLRILVVDDNQLIRDALTQVIEHYADMQVVGRAGNAEDALRLLEELRPDVVILDLHMPGPDGLYILKTLRAQGNQAVVMIFTAYSHHQYRMECTRLGADFFFSKTLDNERLFTTLLALTKKRTNID